MNDTVVEGDCKQISEGNQLVSNDDSDVDEVEMELP